MGGPVETNVILFLRTNGSLKFHKIAVIYWKFVAIFL